MRHLLSGTMLTPNDPIHEVVFCNGRPHSECASIPDYNLLLGSDHFFETLGDLTTLNFYVYNSRHMQAPSSTSVAHPKDLIEEEAPVTDVSVSSVCNGVEHHQDVKIVQTVPRHAPPKPVVSLPERV